MTLYGYDAGTGGGLASRQANRIITLAPDGTKLSERRHTYDTHGRVTSEMLPKGVGAASPAAYTTTFAYGTNGLLASRSRPSTATISTGYNIWGQPTTDTGASGTNTTAYDATTGRPTSDTDPSGRVTTTTYHPTTGLVATTADTAGTVSRSYDDWGRLTNYTDATGALTTYTYDLESNELSRTDQHATTTSTYDPLGRVTGMVDPTGTYGYTYRPDGTMATATLPNGITAATTSRAGVADLDTLTYTNTSGDTLGAFDRDYDLEGRVIVEHRPAGERRYTYDGQGRLTTGTDLDGNGQPTQTRTYGYDANTNRTTKTVTGPGGAGVLTETLTYNAADRLTARTIDGTNRTYTYDPAGNQLTGDSKTYTWTKTDRIKQVSTTVGGTAVNVAYDLDPLARTLRRTETRGGTNTSTTVMHYNDDTDTPTWAAETTAGTTTNTRYVTNPAGVAAEQTLGGATVFPLYTPHGELWASTDTAGQITGEFDHDEFGVPLTRDGQIADYDGWLARQQRADEPELGLIQMGVRLYQPDLGRFLSVDPIYGGSANDYDYANQDPIQNLDLDGRIVTRDSGGGGSMAAASAAVASACKWGCRFIGRAVRFVGRGIKGFSQRLASVAARGLLRFGSNTRIGRQLIGRRGILNFGHKLRFGVSTSKKGKPIISLRWKNSHLIDWRP